MNRFHPRQIDLEFECDLKVPSESKIHSRPSLSLIELNYRVLKIQIVPHILRPLNLKHLIWLGQGYLRLIGRKHRPEEQVLYREEKTVCGNLYELY